MDIEVKFKKLKSSIENIKNEKAELKGALSSKKSELIELKEELKKESIDGYSGLKERIAQLQTSVGEKIESLSQAISNIEALR